MKRIATVAALLFLAFPELADKDGCEEAGKALHDRTRQCLDSAMHDTCIDGALGMYGNRVRKIEGGCDGDTGDQLKDCLVDALKKDRSDKDLVRVCLATYSYD